jgi:putative transposase
MQNWDYKWNASYYITICTVARECYFGNIENKKVILSEIGILADKFWLEIPDHFSYVQLDKHIIMPNHIHGIIIIDSPYGTQNGDVEFAWQSRFYDHVIRDQKSLNKIRVYIRKNPEVWDRDELNPEI